MLNKQPFYVSIIMLTTILMVIVSIFAVIGLTVSLFVGYFLWCEYKLSKHLDEVDFYE